MARGTRLPPRDHHFLVVDDHGGVADDLERAGADGILVLPPYLLNVEQEGLYRHLDAVCRAVGIGVFLYNRDNGLFASSTVARLAEKHKNLIGFKDGHGDVEQLVRIRQVMGDRLVYVGGMPTAEVFAVPYLGAGFTTYSSAVYNFVPKMAQTFYRAVRAGDTVYENDSRSPCTFGVITLLKVWTW
ncbi:MAG: hypothetical protein HC861_11055 [Rhodospirillaceae bacterium]|nr:hypothetical protein [Rhodospirillaceae bacterium]